MRETQITSFLGQHGWATATRQPLAGDASFRRYEKLNLAGKKAMLMDAPPPQENVVPFLSIARTLSKNGLSAPEIYAEDIKNGLLLIEDFGDDTYTRLLQNDDDNEYFLYALATDTLSHLHQRQPSQILPDDLPAYDEDRLSEEACLLTDWYMPEVHGKPTSPAVRRQYKDAWAPLLTQVQAQPQTLVLRDYHVDNLMLLEGRDGIEACGLLDFQDAVSGPAAYDLMSLLEDARRDISDDIQHSMLERYLEAVPELSREGPARDAFLASYAILAAQRHAKVIGIFARLFLRDQKPVYLQHIPRVWRLLERAIEHPVLSGVKHWMDQNLPPNKRISIGKA